MQKLEVQPYAIVIQGLLNLLLYPVDATLKDFQRYALPQHLYCYRTSLHRWTVLRMRACSQLHNLVAVSFADPFLCEYMERIL